MKSIEERFKAIVSNSLDIQPDRIVPTANFVNDLGADSLDEIEITIDVEDEFGVLVPDDAFKLFPTFGHAVEWLKENVPAQRPAAA